MVVIFHLVNIIIFIFHLVNIIIFRTGLYMQYIPPVGSFDVPVNYSLYYYIHSLIHYTLTLQHTYMYDFEQSVIVHLEKQTLSKLLYTACIETMIVIIVIIPVLYSMYA